MDAIGLSRVSTEDQAMYSLDTQDDWIRWTAQERGLNLLKIIREDGGHSDDINREGLKELLMAVHEGVVQVVLVKFHDRIARGDHLPLVLAWLKDHGVRLICGDLPSDAGDALEYLINFYGVAGKIFLRTLRTKTKEGVARALAEGKEVGRPISGMKDGKPTAHGEAIYQAVKARNKSVLLVMRKDRFVHPATKKHPERPASYSYIRRVYQNVKEYYDGTLDASVAKRTKASRGRYDEAKQRKLAEARKFEMWLLERRPLRSERASL